MQNSNINVNVDSVHLVDIAGMYFGYKYVVLFLFVAGLVALFFLVRYFIKTGAGLQLPQAPTSRND